MRLKDKTAVVTGGTRGIGKAMVKRFTSDGARVLFTYSQNAGLAQKLEQEIKESGGIAEGFQINVKDFEKLGEWKEQLFDRFGKIDILVNNAGITRDKALMLMSREDWLDVIDTNLNGMFSVTKQFAVAFMKQREGAILNISSISGVVGLPRQTNYSASKGGINAFTKALAKELAPFGVRVNALAPGFIETDMTAGLKDDFVKDALARIPLGRFGTAEEVARTAAFLVSADADYVTGQIINIDGGLGM